MLISRNYIFIPSFKEYRCKFFPLLKPLSRFTAGKKKFVVWNVHMVRKNREKRACSYLKSAVVSPPPSSYPQSAAGSQVYRLQNPSLLRACETRKAFLACKEKRHGLPTQELLPFLSTRPANVASIAMNNFRTVNCGSVNGCRYGQGGYFFPEARNKISRLSHRYTTPHQADDFHLITINTASGLIVQRQLQSLTTKWVFSIGDCCTHFQIRF